MGINKIIGNITAVQKLKILLNIDNIGLSDSIIITSREPSLKSSVKSNGIFKRVDSRKAIQTNPGDIDRSIFRSGPIPIGSITVTSRKNIIASIKIDLLL
jgi:hypothetical protein